MFFKILIGGGVSQGLNNKAGEIVVDFEQPIEEAVSLYVLSGGDGGVGDDSISMVKLIGQKED